MPSTINAFSSQDNQEIQKCNRCENIQYGMCICGWSKLPPVSKEEETTVDLHHCFAEYFCNSSVKNTCPCHSPKEETTSEWAEELQVEVMEDYLRDARFGERLITKEDEAEHFKIMRKHFDKLQHFIKSQISKDTLQTKAEMLEMIKDEEDLLKISKNGAEEVIMNLRTRLTS